jgi:2-iminobutanoate/2-iminopropanoate deaminase
MAKEIVSTDKAPKAIGPYSQAVKMGRLVFTSGQIPLNPNGEIVSGGVEAQTRRVLENLKAVLEAAGSSMDKVIKTTIFLKDMEQFVTVNGIYAEYFNEPYPARSTVQVAKLPKDVDVEIEAIASLD